MNATNKTQTERMSIAEIEAELAQIKEDERLDDLAHEGRDFKAEAAIADPQQAEEIRAEQTLYSGRKRRRAARRKELEATLTEKKCADVSSRLDNIAKAHDEALESAKSALASIDFDALTTLEQQVSNYLSAEEVVRDHACEAAKVAKCANHKAPGFESIHAPVFVTTYERLERLKAQLASSSQRLSHDHSRLGVPFFAI